MAIDTTAPRTRRTILAGALGGLAAWAASALGRPETISAHDPDDVELGATNAGIHTTTIECDSEPALAGHCKDGDGVFGQSDGPNGIGVHGSAIDTTGNGSGVYGECASPSGTGVYGYASATTGGATGVYGQSDSPDGTAVWGTGGKYGVWGMPGVATATPAGSDPAGVGVFGYGGPSTGVLGFSGIIDMGKPAPAARPKTGVFGYSVLDAAAVGVRGESSVGTGLSGVATVGTGVLATATTGTALRVAGKAKFSRSGRASVPKSKTSVDITVPGGLAGNSVVHATLQTYRAGVSIAAVRTNYPSAGKARIYLTKVASTTASTSVGWFVAEY